MSKLWDKIFIMRKYGKESDSTFNYAFCSECYEEGKFIDEEFTKEIALEKALETVNSKKWFVKKIVTGRINRLERWERNRY